jgi:SAM-dependent methyltransferase
MLSRLRRLYRSVIEQTPAMKRLDAALYWRASMSPIDRHIAIQAASRTDGLFHPSYDLWRAARINKLLELYGVEWFAGKRVLELGCGHADLGALLAEVGAQVTSVDGRAENVVLGKLKHRNIPNLTIVHADLEQDFPALGRFDLMIHFGLLYHLSDVDAHLGQAWRMADDIMLESVVCDSSDPNHIVYFEGDKTINEEGLHGRQNRPSPFYIERLARENGFDFDRVFSRDLNSSIFVYDWPHKNDGAYAGWGRRRMWRLRKRAAASHSAAA